MQAVKESSLQRCYRILGRVSFLIASSSILVSLTSSMVLLISFILHGVEVNASLLLAAFALTFAVYNLDRVINQKEDRINDPDRSRLYMARERMWAATAIASLGSSVVLGAREGLGALLTLLSPLAVYAGYSLGLPSTGRLKEIPVVKNVVLVATWALVPTLLPSLPNAWPVTENGMLLSLLIFCFIFVKIMVNSIVFDLRDVKGDRASGVRTLPLILGVRRLRTLLLVLNATLILWVAACWLLGYFVQYLPVLFASVLYGFWYILFFAGNFNRKRILVDFLVDGEWIPLGLTVALVYALG